MRLNLGCCDRSVAGFIGVDVCPGPTVDEVVDLSQCPWPWPDSSVDEIMAHDLIEHLPDRIATMNQMHRVMKPGAVAHIIVPNAAKGAGFFQDPTHKSPWCLNSFQYFQVGSFAHGRLARSYGITAAFRVVALTESKYQDTHEEVWKITAVLEAVKPGL